MKQSDAFVDPQQLAEVLALTGVAQADISSLCKASREAVAGLNHGDLERWLAALSLLPDLSHQPAAETFSIKADLQSDSVRIDLEATAQSNTAAIRMRIREALEGLTPWRKGPYQIADTFIDTEWRSDWKWQRIAPHLSSLQGRKVLDVGCGNGYHAWRMRGAGAALVLGIDPSLLFMLQFRAVQHFIQDARVQLLPLRMESLPGELQVFDSVFSMGVLYHRRDYAMHLQELRGALRPGGELVLETLILPGEESTVARPAAESPEVQSDQDKVAGGAGRYARMRNVWALPTESALRGWLAEAGFQDLRTVDITKTSTQEQRSTAWMAFESLEQALAPNHHERTIEGWPAPRRATVIARRPEA